MSHLCISQKLLLTIYEVNQRKEIKQSYLVKEQNVLNSAIENDLRT